MGTARVDGPSEYICPARNGTTKRAPLRSDQALLAWPAQLRGSQRGRREVAEGASACAAATACPWRVWRGSKIADAGLQDTQTAVPRPATVAQSAASSCALDGDRPAGSCLGTGACYDDGVACSPDIWKTKQERRLQRLSIQKDNVHDRRSAHLHGIPRATHHLEMRFAPPPTAFPNHIPPCQPALPPAFHTPQSQPIWTPTFC